MRALSSTQNALGVKHHPTAARSGYTERGNPREGAQRLEQVANRMPHEGRIVQEANALGNARDTGSANDRSCVYDPC